MDTGEPLSSRKRRRLGGRVRVTRACDFCKKKKLRCTGTRPCGSCAHAKRECTYKSEYNRGKAPDISITPADQLATPSRTSRGDDGASGGRKKRHSNTENSTSRHQEDETNMSSMAGNVNAAEDFGGSHYSHTPDDMSGRTLFQHRTESISNDGPPSVDMVSETLAVPVGPPAAESCNNNNDNSNRFNGRSSRNSPEPAHTDQEGHYVGPASGVSFLSRALKKLRRTSHTPSTAQQTSVFNFADAPLPPYDPYFLILPRQADAEALLCRYFNFASPTHRYLHEPTVNEWCKEFYASVKKPGPLASGTHEKRAIVLAVLAVATQYNSDDDTAMEETVPSTTFFAASEHQLLLESGGIRLTSIQARLVQSFYLLSQSRVNSAWGLFGTVANLILAIGLHRHERWDPASKIDLVEHEFRKRVFWSAFILDSYLSAGLGRPRSFHEEDLDQEMPLCVDDWQLTPTKILSRNDAGHSLTRASIYHAKLLKIVSAILRELYGIRRLSHERQEEVIRLHDARLAQWREELADFLDISNTDIMMPLFRRQHATLHLAYSHAIILLHRQALLQRNPAPSTTAITATARGKGPVPGSAQFSVQRCLDAATTIVTKLRDLVEKKQMYSAYWFTHYYVFSALVALYLYVVQSRSKPAHTWKPYLDLAQQGLRDLAVCSTETTYAHRYVVVLTELQNEATRPVYEESRPAADVLDAAQSLSVQGPPAGARHGDALGIADLGGPALNPVAPDADALAPNTPPPMTNNDLGIIVPQNADFSGDQGGGPAAAYDDAMGVPLPLLDDQNAGAFRNLSLEGLADLAFMFSAEEAEMSTFTKASFGL